MRTLALVSLAFLCFVPKVNLISFGWTAIGVKPEDLLAAFVLFAGLSRWGSQPLAVSHSLRAIAGPLLAFLASTAMVTAIYSGSWLFVVRYMLYCGMLVFATVRVTESEFSRVVRIAQMAILGFGVLGTLQALGLVGGFHQGTLVSLVSDRPTLLFSNAPEAGGVVLLLWGVVMGSNASPGAKTVVTALAVYLNLVMGNRVSLGALAVGFAYWVANSGRSQRGLSALWARAFRSAAAISVLIGFVALAPYLPRFVSVLSVENLTFAADYLKQNLGQEVLGVDPYQRYIDYGASLYLDQSFAYRFQKWTFALNVLMNGHLAGIGAGNLGDGTDSFYLRVVGESGVVGLAALALVAARLWRHLPRSGALAGVRLAFLLLLLEAFFLDIFYFSRIGYLFWIFVAIALAPRNYGSSPVSIRVTQPTSS